MKKPLIGLIPLYDEEKESLWMLPGYMDGLIAAGAVPVMLPLTNEKEILTQLVSQCDGFLLTGGHDVSPTLYGKTATKQCGVPCDARDEMEKILLGLALEDEKPMLGICRGIQFMNAYLGGTLYQDLPTEHPSDLEHHQTPPYDEPIHKVILEKGSPLEKLLNKRDLAVNSYHHQAIKELSPKLTAMAYSTDDLVEAVYMKDKKFVWAVQWHPEFSYRKDEDSQRIFEAFVGACNY